MAHIRQILANLSISVSEFKKNPKTVIKAVKSEPIAVIINDKPAFYCVPADILESLYSKFYEMNEIQNIQELNNDSDDPVCSSDDDSFGVRDIFQTIEDEQAAKMSSNDDDDLVDPIKNSVADPLDEEVANKLNCSIDNHLLDSNNKVVSLNAPNSMDLSFDDLDDSTNLNSFDEFSEIDPICNDGFNNSLLNEFDTSDKLNSELSDDLNYVSSLSDLDDLRSPAIKSKDESHSEATLAHAEKVVKQEQEKAQDKEQSSTKANSKDINLASQKELNITDGSKCNPAKSNASPSTDKQAKSTSGNASSPCESEDKGCVSGSLNTLKANTNNSSNNNQVCEELGEVNTTNTQSMRNLVSGPHSFSLEHVAKTYSPYKQKKLLEKRQQELKKEQKAEQKAKQKELKKLEKAAKYLKLDPKSVQEAEEKKAKNDLSKDIKKSKKSKFVKVKKIDL